MKGFSLIELMVTVGIIGIISAIAFPMYTDYVITARSAVMTDNLQSIRLFQEDRRLDRGKYVEGNYDPADPDNAIGLKTLLGWEPGTETDDMTYVVVCGTDASDNATSHECTRTSHVNMTATHSQGGDPVTLCVGRSCP